MAGTVTSPAPPAAPLAAPLAPGTALAPGYEVVAHMHRSRVLDTYDVWSERRAARCVAKVLKPDRLDDDRSRERLVAEGHLLARFTHPHIVRAYETLENPLTVVILETLGGATLDHVIKASRRRLGEQDLVLLGLQVASAVHYLHREGYLHLDLKPANVVVADDGRARVLDLSLARPPGPIKPGVGTRPYQSPEQARGGAVGETADVWGIGTVLWEAATGGRAFPMAGDEPPPQLSRRAETVRRRRRRLSRGLAQAIDDCLEPDPGDRPAVADLMSRLQRAGD